MNHPYFQSQNAKARYENLLQNAESFRRVNKLKRDAFGQHTPIRSILGNTLIALGAKLSVDVRTNA
jgi:hypothetical protein